MTVAADTSFGEAPLFDGSYACVDTVTFDCEDGEIWTTVYED